MPDSSVSQTDRSGYAAREAALDRINDDPAWAQRAYGAMTETKENDMPSMNIKLDLDRGGPFDAIQAAGIESPGDSDRVIHLTGPIEVGTLRAGMASGKDSVMFCFALPDGRVVLAETSAELFVTAARSITGWQEGRRDRGED